MRGTILGIHGTTGVLVGDDQRRYDFPLSEWRSAGTPVAGQIVDFVEDNGQARAVFGVPGAGFRAGGGHSNSFVLSAIALACLLLGFIVPVLPTIAAFVLGVVASGQAQAERDENALLMARIAWIGALVMIGLGVLIMLAVFAFIGTMGYAGFMHGWDF